MRLAAYEVTPRIPDSVVSYCIAETF